MHRASLFLLCILIVVAFGAPTAFGKKQKVDPEAAEKTDGAETVPVTSSIRGALGGIPLEVFRRSPPARITVDSGDVVAVSNAQGKFVLPHLPPGSHLLDVDFANYIFPPVRVDVSKKGIDRFRAVLNDGSGTVLLNAMDSGAPSAGRRRRQDKKKKTGSKKREVEEEEEEQEEEQEDEEEDYSSQKEMVIPVQGAHQYFIPREQFSVWSILKNPLVIMMVVSLGLMTLMPKMADAEDMKQSMKDMQRLKKMAQDKLEGKETAPPTRKVKKVADKAE